LLKAWTRHIGLFVLLLTVILTRTEAFGSGGAKLIEWGWNTPTPTFVKEHIREMEKVPFDGLVLDLTPNVPKNGAMRTFGWSCWSPEPLDLQDYSGSLAALKGTEFRRFTDNFIRFNVTPGNVDWFDKGFSSVLLNASFAAKVAKSCRLKGILFDIEHYEGSPFNYLSRPRRPSHSFAEYQAQVEKCGRDFMTALTLKYPEITILLTYGYHLADRGGGKPESKEYGLLSSFLDGMREAASPNSLIIDGWEFSYGYKVEEQYKAARDLIYKKAGARQISGPPDRCQCGFGIWLDNRKIWNGNDFRLNYFSPEEFLASLRFAIKYSDRYVWIYSELANWWNGQMPEDYISALIRARTQ